jgi:hypothetical protein
MSLLKERLIPVTDKFLSFAREEETIHGWDSFRGDALLFEKWLIDEKIVEKPLNWRHDFIYKDMKIDVKEVEGSWFNVHKLKLKPNIPAHKQQTKMEQYKESIVTGNLTHFLFYTSNRSRKRYLKEGEVIGIFPIAIVPAKQIWKLANNSPSQYDEYERCVPLDTIKILGEDYENLA